MARKSINPTSAKKPTIEPTIGPAIQALSFPLSELLRVASGEADVLAVERVEILERFD